MKTKILAAAALASSLALPTFAADTILFDPDGTGNATNGTFAVGAFDWSASSTLSDDSIPTADGESFDTYSHGTLAGFLDTAGDPAGAPTGLNTITTGFEITFISGFTETISNISTSGTTLVDDNGAAGGGDDVYSFTQTITLEEAASQNVNFFQIYYDDLSDGSGLKSSSLAGTGFDDGLLILDASVETVDGNFTTQFEFVDANNDGLFDPLDGDLLQGFVILDQSSNGDDWGGQLTVEGQGATALESDVTYQHNDFFLSDISSLVADLFFNTSNVLPFNETNPSQSFDDGSGGTLSPSLGDVNGLSGDDILFQTDANNSFLKTNAVPEPGSILLLGMGLFLLGMVKRRKAYSLNVT